MTHTDIDRSHDQARRSWVASANDPATDFPIQNLPFGVFRETGTSAAPRIGIAIGDMILDASAVAPLLGAAGAVADSLHAPDLRPLMGFDPEAWTALRLALSDLLAAGSDRQQAVTPHLHPQHAAEMFLPARPGGFIDFYASLQHATNAGSIFRPTAPLLPNYKYLPVAYNGRASTVRVSGHDVRRPHGQARRGSEDVPVFGPSQRLDFETEFGVFLGGHSQVGQPVPLAKAWRHIFGFCLLNDWSARDIQAWEYQPLGPFLGKSFATTISPWVVTAQALQPFRAPLAARDAGDPAPLPHLSDAGDLASGAVDVMLETRLLSDRMRADGADAALLSKASTRQLYWTVGQMLTHLTSNGCNIEAGDLFGTGTVSGDDRGSLGSLLEITRAGSEPLSLPNGEQLTFLRDGDEIIMTGRCTRQGFASIGFGACRARVT